MATGQTYPLAARRRVSSSRVPRRRNDLRTTAYFGLSGVLASAIFMSVGFFVYGAVESRQDFIFLSISILIGLMPLSVSFLHRHRFDLFEPINLVAAAIIFGTTLRAFYLVFMPYRPQAQFLMMGQSFGEINQRIIWIVAGVALFCIGYSISFGRASIRVSRSHSRLVISRARLRSVLLIALGSSFIGVLLYAAYFQIDLTSNLLTQSVKRAATYFNSEGEQVYGSAWQAQLAQFGLYGGFVLVTAMIARVVRINGYWLVLAAALLISGSIVPIVGQSRTPIILIVISIVVFSYYYGKINLRYALVGVVAIALFTSAMGELRSVNSYGSSKTTDFIDNTVGSGNGFDAVRSTAILSRMPERADYLYGTSYLAIPFFWVPRAVWPDKPPTGLGAFVKTKLFGVRNVVLGGWPPGFVAESYMNFGYVGILIIPFLIGFGVRSFYGYFRPWLGKSYVTTTIYAALLYKSSFEVAQDNMAQAVTTGLLIVLPVAIIVRLSSRRIRTKIGGSYAAATRRPSPRKSEAAGLRPMAKPLG